MGSALDMSLDDLIKSSKTTGRGAGRGTGRGGGRGALGRGRGLLRRAGRGFGRGAATGPIRRANVQRGVLRPAPYTTVKPLRRDSGGAWQQNDMFKGLSAVQGGVLRTVELQTGTKLYISNLDFNVSNEDIKELFSEVGELKRCSVHFDRSGRSKGTAEVVFARKIDGLSAVKRYNNVLLDGKPMKIDIIGNKVVGAAGRGRGAAVGTRAVVVTGGVFRAGRGTGGRGIVGGRGRGGRVGAAVPAVGGRGRGRGGRGRGGRGGDAGPTKTAEELDKELDSYHAEAMQT